MSSDSVIPLLPKHVAIIMDGNGRWAKSRGLPRTAGHKAGAARVREIISEASDQGVESVTVYAFSTENWLRPESEVGFLMRLICFSLEREAKILNNHNVRVRFLGDRSRLPQRLQASMDAVETLTAHNTGLRFNAAVNYGSRWEIAQAAQKIAEKARSGQIAPQDINEDYFAQHLCLPDCNEIDLLIRTSGEFRVSNFLLWQIAYAEIYVTEQFFPEFGRQSFAQALEWYQSRERRLGKTSEQL